MKQDIRTVKSIEDWIRYFSDNLGWYIDFDEIDDIDDITYQYTAEDLGLKPESFAKVKSLKQMAPLTNDQPWGVFCVEFEGKRFEITALRRILSTLIPRKRRYITDRKTWNLNDLLFICSWGEGNETTLGLAHFEEREGVLPQLKVIYCAPAKEDTHNIRTFEERISHLEWPANPSDTERWRGSWSAAFTSGYRETIHFAAELTLKLAEEARAIRDRILHTLEIETEQGYVHGLYSKFKEQLLHDMKEQDFADMYAQTIVYGLFSARCMDDTPESFSAAEAVSHIPNTNPFLKSLLQECLDVNTRSGISFDELEVGNVVDILARINPKEIVQDFGRQTGGGREDPVLHFYEEFLNAYDKTQKVQRGVYYTPQPVVNFIVRAVDDILKSEFGLKDGLASTETKLVEMPVEKAQKGASGLKTVMEKVEVPAVQVLDPATGTGTFLRQVILTIYENFKAAHKGEPAEAVQKAWNEYVPEHLLPRINGFELMMAPYAVAHMKLAMVLQETGYDFHSDKRLQVYLTNTLEEPNSSGSQMSLFSDPLAMESVEANKAKSNSGINILIGNPPYSGESANKSPWIMKLMEDYKKEPGGEVKLQERNPKWLNDDYVKFIKYCENRLESSDKGILAFINPHGFIDNPTFRGMRWKLLQTFDEIYINDLHGNSNRKEKCPDGSKDDNVFDIQQGVSINFFIKKRDNIEKETRIFHYDLWGIRNTKNDFLDKSSIFDIPYSRVKIVQPEYNFKRINLDIKNEYNNGFSIIELFKSFSVGVVTAKDKVLIAETKNKLVDQVREFYNFEPDETKIRPIYYRPFDKEYIYYDSKLLERSRENIMTSFFSKNLALITARSNKGDDCSQFLVTDVMAEAKCGERTTQSACFPLYIYRNSFDKFTKELNLNEEILNKISKIVNKPIQDFHACEEDCYKVEDILSYIYGILYSEKYRKKYKEFINSDFPKIPYPKNEKEFLHYSKFGGELMQLHLSNIDNSENNSQECCNLLDKTIEKITYINRNVYINKYDSFTGLDDNIWNFTMCGYQPIQKYLKDRRGERINSITISKVQYMIAAIRRTIEIMDEIDAVIEL